MRKDAGFEVMDHITVYADGNAKIQAIMEQHADEIKNVVLAEAIVFGSTAGSVKEWNLNGETVTLGVQKQ